ncbi:MAG: redox-sensing transcriptional repressor Rex [Desulfovibrionales bacterium]
MTGKDIDHHELPGETIHRFRLYLPLLRLYMYKEKRSLSISLISEFLGIPSQKVLEDFSYCPDWNKSEDELIEVSSLIDCINNLLGEKEFKEALLVGIGRLGTSLLKNETIAGSGLKIVAAFDIDPAKVGKIISGIKVQSMDKLESFVRQMHLRMAMIATTPENALQAVEQVKKAGIQVVWNFTPTNIPDQKGLIVQNTTSAQDLEKDYQNILARI